MAIEQIRSVLLIALALVLFLMWQAWETDHAGKPAQPTHPAQEQTQPQSTAKENLPSVPKKQQASAAPTTAPSSAPEAAAAGAGSVHIKTDVLDVVIDLHGGNVVQVKLPKYPVSTNKPHTPVELLENNPQSLYVADSGLIGNEPSPNHVETTYHSARNSYTLAPGEDTLDVPLQWTSPQGVTFTKIYRFHRDKYTVDVIYRVANHAKTAWSGRMYGQLERVPPKGAHHFFGGTITTYTGGVISTTDKHYQKVSFSDMGDEPVDASSKGGWAAMIQHYFASAWIPPEHAENHYYSKKLSDDRYALGVLTSAQTVAPGEDGQLGMRLYVGPKDQQRMSAVAPYLERTVDYGWLWFIAEPLFWLLAKIHSFVGNWGWAIVLLTVLIKLAFFQLSATSYKSMARMRRLQPRMNAIRERYAGDRQRMNQAMMELYKTEKVNPLGGCLPIAVQIPVFLSLYWMLIANIDLRQAPFIFWIHDLAAHDPYFVLPILQGLTMVLQQRLNPSPPDPIQAKVMMALPVVFTFFFLFFPAGLVLYWLVNNILSVAQQWVITRKIVPQTQ